MVAAVKAALAAAQNLMLASRQDTRTLQPHHTYARHIHGAAAWEASSIEEDPDVVAAVEAALAAAQALVVGCSHQMHAAAYS